MTVSIIGLGKLGASMAAAMASRGVEVIGVDINEAAVERLKNGEAPAQETDLGKTIAENRERIRATMSHEEAILGSEISFVIVPTPSDDRGAFALQYAQWAFRELGKALKKKEGYHVMVLSSTVLPGSCRHGLIPILEEESGKKCGEDFGFCYSPEFIALGTVIRDFLNPDFTLVGEFDERSGDGIESVYRAVMQGDPPCRRMSIENAELTKICVNSYITMKITFANMLAELCERIPGGDVDVVSEALGSDERIGRKYLTGGLGFGGPCFPRDNVALAFLAGAVGAGAEIPKATDDLNRALAAKFVDKIRGFLKPGMTVAVLGLSYKPASHIVEESQGLMLARSLADAGMRVLAYDPLATEGARTELQYHAIVTDTIGECLRDAEVVLLANPDPAFRDLGAKDFLGGNEKVTVIDFWRTLPESVSQSKGIEYVPMGRTLNPEEAERRLRDLWGVNDQRGAAET